VLCKNDHKIKTEEYHKKVRAKKSCKEKEINIQTILDLLQSENSNDFILANNILEAQEIELSDEIITSLRKPDINFYKIGKYKIAKFIKFHGVFILDLTRIVMIK